MKYILPKNKSDFVCTTSFKKLCKESFFDYKYLLQVIFKMSDKQLLNYYYKENASRTSYYIKKDDINKLFNITQLRIC